MAVFLVTLSIITDDDDTKEDIKERLENVLTGEFSWGHLEVKKARIVADE